MSSSPTRVTWNGQVSPEESSESNECNHRTHPPRQLQKHKKLRAFIHGGIADKRHRTFAKPNLGESQHCMLWLLPGGPLACARVLYLTDWLIDISEGTFPWPNQFAGQGLSGRRVAGQAHRLHLSTVALIHVALTCSCMLGVKQSQTISCPMNHTSLSASGSDFCLCRHRISELTRSLPLPKSRCLSALWPTQATSPQSSIA